jgi:ferric-dicitrate binding protein FerR (iron transport regulator)
MEELISLSVSGELTSAEETEMSSHLASCASCRDVLRREQKLWGLLQRARSSGQPPAEVTERLALTPRRHVLSSSPKLRLRRWLVAAAALMVVGVLLSFNAKTPPPPVLTAQVLRGEVETADGEDWRKTERLFSGQFFRVPGTPGASARLRLSDGSHVDLERGAFGRLGRGFGAGETSKRILELPTGALTAQVVKREGAFTVRAPGGDVTAVGTRFWVRSGPAKGEEIVGRREIISGTMAAALAVAVFEGSVLVRKAGASETTTVGADRQAVVAKDGATRVSPRTVADAVPADAWIFLSGAGREHWLKAYESSALGAIAREKEVETFLRPLLDLAKEKIAAGQKRAEENTKELLKLDEIANALLGEIGLAIVGWTPKANGLPGEEDPVLLLVAEVGKNAAAFNAVTDNFMARLTALGVNVRDLTGVEAYRNADITTLNFGNGTVFAFAQAKGYFLCAPDLAAVKRGIDCLEGVAPALSAPANIEKPSDALLRVSADAARLIKREWDKTEGPGSARLKALWKFSGFLSTDRLEYRLKDSESGFRESLTVSLAKVQGLLTLLNGAKVVEAEKTAAEAPNDALAFFSCSLPSEKIIPTIFLALNEALPQETENFRKLLADVKTKGVDLETLLYGVFTGESVAYVAMPAGGGFIPEFVVSLRHKNVEILNAVFQQLLPQQPAVAMAGGKMFTIPTRNPLLSISLLTTNERLFIASSPAAAKRAETLKNAVPAATLAGNEAFLTALRSLPPGMSAVHYADFPKIFSLGCNLAQPFLAGSAAKGEKPFGLDLRLIPPAQTVAQHLKPSCSAFYAAPSALRMESTASVPNIFWVGVLGALDKRQKDRQAAAEQKLRGNKEAEEPPVF